MSTPSIPTSSSSSNPSNPTTIYDVIVVGGGNAGFTAATTAIQTLRSKLPPDSPPPRVLVLEKAPQSESGGNTYHTAGAYRFTFSSLEDLLPLVSTSSNQKTIDPSRIEMPPYLESDFLADMYRVTSNKTDPALAEILVRKSRDAVDWIHRNGGKWELSFHRQAYEVDGKFRFWGGLVVCFEGGGKGLVEWHRGLAEREEVEVWYDCAVTDLLVSSSSTTTESRKGEPEAEDTDVSVIGVKIQSPSPNSTNFPSKRKIFSRGGVILASGGYQASSDLRTKHLGPQWMNAHVRGNPYSTGDVLTMTSPSSTNKIHAKRHGDFSSTGCHSVCWDAESPSLGGDRVLTNAYTKSGYPLGIMVNIHGERFVDEGQDLRNYTYAVFGREVLKQPHGRAWQVWDDDGVQLLRKEEYGEDVTRLIVADTLEGLGGKIAESHNIIDDGSEERIPFNTTKFLETVKEFNTSCLDFQRPHPEIKFNPAVKDGLSTSTSSEHSTVNPPKSNWARPLLKPPFVAVQVTCGITFTFGGLAVVPETGQVRSENDDGGGVVGGDDGEVDGSRGSSKDDGVISGLYACGEAMGGLFWGNYPGGSGLTAGTVWGRIAGEHAADRAFEFLNMKS